MNKTLLALSVFSAFTLVGCGGSSESATSNTTTPAPVVASTNRTVTITPVLGQTQNAEVTLESTLPPFKATGNTSSTGKVTFTNIPTNIELLFATVTGGATSTYLEEADDFKPQPLNENTQLRAAFIFPSASDSADIAITALTEAAVSYAFTQNTTLTYDNVPKANKLVADTFGISDILLKPSILKNTSDYALLAVDDSHIAASRYSVLLAAVAKVTANKTTSTSQASVKFAKQLAADFISNGDINLAGEAYSADTLQTQINTVIAALTLPNPLKQTFMIKTTAPTTGSGSTGGGSTGGGSTGGGSTGGDSTGGGSTGGGSTGGDSTGGDSTGGGSTFPTITTPYADKESLTNLIGSYTGLSNNNETCSVTIDNMGVITIANATLSKSATLNGDLLDEKSTKNNIISSLVAFDSTSPSKRLSLGITTDSTFLVLYYDTNNGIDLGCRTIKN